MIFNNMMRKLPDFSIIVLIVLIAFGAANCKKTRKEIPFETTSSGLKYKFHYRSGKDSLRVNNYDIVYILMNFRTEDSVWFKSGASPISIQVENKEPADFSEGLMLMNEGDSATFAISPEKFFIHTLKYTQLPEILKNYNELFVDVKLVKRIPEPPILKIEREEAEKRKHMEADLIRKYVTDNRITVEPTPSGLYYIELKKGAGRMAEPGKKLKVHYKAFLLTGEMFDSSYDRNKPVTFVLGKGERIPAWDEGFRYMSEGGKARFIVPSSLGYGAETRGNIKPYTPLIFDVELLEVLD